MKLTIIISQLERPGGFERIFSALVQEGFKIECILLYLNEKSEFKSFLDSKEIKNKYIRLKSKRDYPMAFLKLLVLLFFRRPQIVHTHLRDADILGQLVAYLLRIKNRVYTRHSSTFNHLFFPSAVKWDKMVNLLSTHIISISDATRTILLQEGVPESKIVNIEHGFDLERFKKVNVAKVNELRNKYNLTENSPIIGVISRQIEWKGIQFIIPAFKRFMELYPSSKLILANAIGDYKENIQEMLKELPKTSYIEVEFESDIASLYKTFDIFVHVPIDSQIEAFGQIYVESLAAGIPSIFTKSGIANDLCIDKFNCLLVDYKNSEDIFNALLIVKKNKDLAQIISKNGERSVEKYSIELYLSKLINFYKLLIV